MSIIFNSSVYYGFINNINPEEITDSSETEEELLDLCKFTNLQPLQTDILKNTILELGNV